MWLYSESLEILVDPFWGVRFNYASRKGETSNVVGDFGLGTQRRSFCCSSQQWPGSIDTGLSVCVSGLTWDQVGASQTACFRLCRLAAHYVKGPSGMVSILAPPAGGKATFLLPEGFVSPPGWLLAAPHEDAVNRELVGDLAGDLQGISLVSLSCGPKP